MKKLFLFALLLMYSVVTIAQEKPEPVSPFHDGNLLTGMDLKSNGNVYTDVFATLLEVFTFGGNRLVATQNPDGGWGWPLTGTSALNTLGPIAMGLAQAYQQTGILTQRTALLNAGALLLTKIGTFSPSDGYLAAQLDEIFGVTTYTAYVKTNFYDKLAAGTYERAAQPGVYYTTASYIQRIRDTRSGSQANMAAWDIGMGLVGASMCGGSTTEWIAGVKAEINELDGNAWYDVIGLAGAVYGLAFVNENFDPTAGWHIAASNINDLATTLASYQIAGGGFAWNQAWVIPNDGNETIQETAYAILALNEVNRTLYLTNIQGAANYTMSVQLGNGGWENYPTSGENNELTGEALWGMSVTYPSTVNVTQTTPIVYNFITADVKMEFITLPSGGGNVTVTRYNEAPTPFPSGYTNVGMWLDITSTMPNYSFDVTVHVDVFGIAGFDATTIVMYKTSGGSWLAVPGGSYLASDPMFGGHPSFSFVTNHFTPFTFINTPADAYNVYLSSGTSAASGFIYPNTVWGVTGYEGLLGDDWDFTAPISLYIVPAVGSVFGASDITVQWDNTMYSYSGVDPLGGIYDNPAYQFFYNQLGSTNSVTINASRTDNNNFIIGTNNYIAKLNLNLLKPGFAPISFTALDFRAFDGLGGQLGVFMTGNNGQVKSYLGDVASHTSTLTGDGLVDFYDLTPWSISYWSGVGGFGLTNYKVKYDIGPTSTNTVYGTPVPDTKIQFEDLVIFSMSYGFSANHVYPKLNAEPTLPVDLQLGEPVIVGSQTRVPLLVSGGVQNVRAMSLTFAGKFGSLVSVEKGALLNEFTNPVMVMSNVDGNQIYVDLAVFGAEEVGINTEGEVLTLIFEGNTEINISNADVRNVLNGPMAVNISGSDELVPVDFALMQNYPNPFNPSTTINYSLPTQAMVELSIFNALGEKVATLVNEIKDAGKHTVEFNAVGYSSGIYFYQIKANDFVSVKKMILMK